MRLPAFLLQDYKMHKLPSLSGQSQIPSGNLVQIVNFFMHFRKLSPVLLTCSGKFARIHFVKGVVAAAAGYVNILSEALAYLN